MNAHTELGYEVEVVAVEELRLEDCRRVLAALVEELGLVVALAENTACSQGPTFKVYTRETAEALARKREADRCAQGW
jgi:hypothetical protein